MDGNWRRRSRNAPPIGLKHNTMCRFARVHSTKWAHSSCGDAQQPRIANTLSMLHKPLLKDACPMRYTSFMAHARWAYSSMCVPRAF
eukprot:349632-Chlamydomonas_euryale.AAC.18